MTPLDIVKVLTAAAPIVASVASVASKSESSNIERKEQAPAITNNISVTINNHFNTSNPKDAINIASEMQNQLMHTISSGTRYML